jgi:type II secretory pathway pseudopilin PulG
MRKRPFRAAFTLLEILVAVAVTALLGVLIVQLIAATTSATQQSNRGIDAASQARLAFDRIGMDLAARLRRTDVDFAATSSLAASTNTPLLFYSEVTSAGLATTNNRGLSLVGYQISTNAEMPRRCLLRGGRAVGWADGGLIGSSTNGLPAPLSTAPLRLEPGDFDVLASAVIHAVVGFQLYPDGQSARLANGDVVPEAAGQWVYSAPVRLNPDGAPSALIDVTRISSLIVGVVAMDPRTMDLLNDSQVGQLAAAFAAPDNGQLPMAKWAAIADNPDSFPASIPLPARQSLRVFQRAFPVTPFVPR